VAEDQKFSLPPLAERPLVTFALFAYNQEKYIREAVEGAFAQTYEPLEIILSDDCSTDRTLEIMKEMIENYCGPHKVAVVRNICNLGIGEHINKVCKQSSGQLIFLAAGDDISCSNRVENVVSYWIMNNKRFDSIWSAIQRIDHEGRELGITRTTLDQRPTFEQVRFLVPSVLGCSHVISKRLYETFGELNKSIVYEDRAIAFRSLILGGHGYLDAPLVKYRIHSASTSNNVGNYKYLQSPKEQLILHQRHLTNSKEVLKQYSSDFNKMYGKNTNYKNYAIINNTIEEEIEIVNSERMLCADNLRTRVIGCFKLLSTRRRSLGTYCRFFIGVIHPLAPFHFRRFRALAKKRLLTLK